MSYRSHRGRLLRKRIPHPSSEQQQSPDARGGTKRFANRLAYGHHPDRVVSDDLSWQPAIARRSAFPVVASVVVALGGLAGIAIGSLYPLSQLVEAIERNGVPPQRDGANVSSAPALADAARSGGSSPSASQSAMVGPSLAPNILNPGTASSETSDPPRPVAELAAPKVDQPAVHKDRDRRVLVVIRRVGPPYDTKVLRGRIQGGRLVVDERDRRGIIIR